MAGRKNAVFKLFTPNAKGLKKIIKLDQFNSFLKFK